MSPLEVIGATVGPALATFYLVVRWTCARVRRGDLATWDEADAFCFAAVMAVIWPLTLLWLIGRRPTRPERQETERRRVAKLLAETERQLGIGSER